MDRRRFALGLLTTVGLQARALASDGRAQSEAQPLMGTRVRITVVHADAARRRRALDATWHRMRALATAMSRYRPDQALQALAAAAGRPGFVALPPPVVRVLDAAGTVAAFTGGAFDPTVGAYRDWRFDDPAARHVVDAGTLRAQRELVDWRGLQIAPGGRGARLARAGMALDLGGIAKLPILEAGLQELDAHGIGEAMIDGGGDVLCRGRRSGDGWRIGIRDPRSPQHLVGVVSLHEGVVASSGDYERGFDRDGRRWHHVLDPASGLPTRGVHGVTLVARDVDSLNGLGSAVMVAGLDAARVWLGRRLQVDALIVTSSGRWLTPGMAARLRLAR